MTNGQLGTKKVITLYLGRIRSHRIHIGEAS